ncbi:cytosolic protein [Salipaludibacillus neizhouensis]|uniref:Cytosolic protein n=1 Tax=Salipaludibacillus neizhouensis TaxID=885475 RepID=A0A3A9K3L4_9BACI|nr:DUF3055 domain-containing protein [Salipaludibacillus neizhouensis]RKL65470.1 cytosolic protein [Salipaludibacillus neizhouensis]
MSERFFLYDDEEETNTRFVSFMGEAQRFDLAITTTSRHYGKKLVLDMQSNRFAILGSDDLETEGYIERAFDISDEEEGNELRNFLLEII